MDEKKENIYFLYIGLQKIKFASLNKSKEVFFTKEMIVNDLSINENLETLKIFLDKNILYIENKLNTYVKDIYLILDTTNFLEIDMSTVHNSRNFFYKSDDILNFLSNIKNNFIKNLDDYDLTHMIINKYILDGSSYISLPDNIKFNNIHLEIKFICLKKIISQKLKKIFSKYEIIVDKIFYHKYVNQFQNSDEENIFNLAIKLKDGLNPKEIFLVNKLSKNIGFFEKFFNFFR